MSDLASTHPWLRFEADLRHLPPTFWMSLGEAKSKCDHVAQVPMRSDIARKLYQLYLAKGIHATTAIEGNTLTEEQVLEKIEGRLNVSEPLHYQAQEVQNVHDACIVIEDRVFNGELDRRLKAADILEYNAIVLRDLEPDDGVVPGRIREASVVVGNVYRGPPARDCEALLNRMCDWLNSDPFMEDLSQQFGVGASLIRAILAHLYIAWIHPFGDGNGRTARLIEFQVLVASGVPSPSAHLLSNHYNATRPLYYRRLREASQNGGDPSGFLCYAVDGFIEQIRGQIQEILVNYLQDLVWRDFIEQHLHGESDAIATRHREILVSLFRSGRAIRKRDLRTLSPRLTELYTDKTDKTVTRDVNKLRILGLIVDTPEGLQANRAHILRFLPSKAALG